MHTHFQNLEAWFLERPKWLQDAARRILSNGELTKSDLKEIVLLCKKEAGIAVEGETLVALPIPTGAFSTSETNVALRLNSISEIEGINNLSPRKPLIFGNQPLTVIYGQNGSGKSGYTRMLKHACGARKPGELHSNAFTDIPKVQKCKISYTIGGESRELVWSPAGGIHQDLSVVALYDTECAQVYVTEENQVAYEPGVLNLFRLLVDVCSRVDESLGQEIIAKVSSTPAIPPEWKETASAIWYGTFSRSTTDSEISANCLWDDNLEQKLISSTQRLAEAHPAEKAKALRKTKAHASDLVERLEVVAKKLDAVSCKTLLAAKRDAKARRHVSDIDAKKVFESAPLNGIESESWKLLWEQARAYAEKEGYKDIPFPNVGEEAKCVLCQQPLDSDAKKRLLSFESFVKGSLEAEAAKAEKHLAKLLGDLPLAPVAEDLDGRLDLAGLSEEGIREDVRALCNGLNQRHESFLKADEESEMMPVPDLHVIAKLREAVNNLEDRAEVFDNDAKGDKKAELKKEVNELAARKWLSQQKTSIETERERQRAIHKLQEARKFTNTRALSEKKSALSEILISAAYIDRFQKELKTLGASRIRVAIEKTRTTKGQVWHQVKLKGVKRQVKTAEVLSEGEFRIVSLADFLADVEGRGGNTPFIFDDPISSLDQVFEEATAGRLVELSKSRQVIVFTHRLSMVACLEELADKQHIEMNVLSLRNESWGAGEPNETPIFATKPEKVLNTLLNDRLPKAKKILQEKGSSEYDLFAKGICSDIRNTIERLVESTLLDEVVIRFRKSVQTYNRIHKLARIKPEDCNLLDEMMTKYSKYEHSQSNETPVPLPEPDELEEDLKKIKAWRDEFAKRPAPGS